MNPLDQTALQQLFTHARTHSNWQDRGIAADTLRQLYALAAMGPTSMNAQPGQTAIATGAGRGQPRQNPGCTSHRYRRPRPGLLPSHAGTLSAF
jgi:3-hydroxypropanoate dehydrogenase